MEYFVHILILVCFYAALGSSLNLLSGYTGQVSVCHAAFYGLGAYITAVLLQQVSWPWLLVVASSMMVVGVLSVLIGGFAMGLRRDYFVIATFAFQVAIVSVLNNWVEVTQGPLGITKISGPSLFGTVISSKTGLLLLVLCFLLAIQFVVVRIANSPFGRVLLAIKDDELFAQSVGKNVTHFKLVAFTVSAALAALMGSFYASYFHYIDPRSFTIQESIFILSLVIIGGSGTKSGPILGSVILVSVPELLRLLGLPLAAAPNIRQIMYGALLVAAMMWRPGGLIGTIEIEEG